MCGLAQADVSIRAPGGRGGGQHWRTFPLALPSISGISTTKVWRLRTNFTFGIYWLEQMNGATVAVDPCVDGPPLASLNSGVAMLVGAAMCHVSDLLVRLIAPLAIMPFARFGSRSQTRT